VVKGEKGLGGFNCKRLFPHEAQFEILKKFSHWTRGWTGRWIEVRGGSSTFARPRRIRPSSTVNDEVKIKKRADRKNTEILKSGDLEILTKSWSCSFLRKSRVEQKDKSWIDFRFEVLPRPSIMGRRSGEETRVQWISPRNPQKLGFFVLRISKVTTVFVKKYAKNLSGHT
jgi:hypothetical protein